MKVTGFLQERAWAENVLPAVEQVRALVWSVPVAAPSNSIRYTNTYLLLNDQAECIVVDPGWDSDEGWSQLLHGLRMAGTSVDRIVGIVATHLHMDHLGMVRRLANATDAWIGMHRDELAALEALSSRDFARARDRTLLPRLGVPDELIAEVSAEEIAIARAAAAARPTLLFDRDQDLPLAGRRIRVLSTPGHTPGHVCVADLDSGLVMTGDHVLPRITSNVGLTGDARAPSILARYYSSLESMHAWNDFEVCPGHEFRFFGLGDRADELIAHQRARSGEILTRLERLGTSTVWGLAQGLSWSRGWSGLRGVHLRAAVLETAAHVEFLVGCGDVQVVPAGSTGALRFRRSAQSSGVSAGRT